MIFGSRKKYQRNSFKQNNLLILAALAASAMHFAVAHLEYMRPKSK